jgi:hypothetical protein
MSERLHQAQQAVEHVQGQVQEHAQELKGRANEIGAHVSEGARQFLHGAQERLHNLRSGGPELPSDSLPLPTIAPAGIAEKTAEKTSEVAASARAYVANGITGMKKVSEAAKTGARAAHSAARDKSPESLRTVATKGGELANGAKERVSAVFGEAKIHLADLKDATKESTTAAARKIAIPAKKAGEYYTDEEKGTQRKIILGIAVGTAAVATTAVVVRNVRAARKEAATTPTVTYTAEGLMVADTKDATPEDEPKEKNRRQRIHQKLGSVGLIATNPVSKEPQFDVNGHKLKHTLPKGGAIDKLNLLQNEDGTPRRQKALVTPKIDLRKIQLEEIKGTYGTPPISAGSPPRLDLRQRGPHRQFTAPTGSYNRRIKIKEIEAPLPGFVQKQMTKRRNQVAPLANIFVNALGRHIYDETLPGYLSRKMHEAEEKAQGRVVQKTKRAEQEAGKKAKKKQHQPRP